MTQFQVEEITAKVNFPFFSSIVGFFFTVVFNGLIINNFKFHFHCQTEHTVKDESFLATSKVKKKVFTKALCARNFSRNKFELFSKTE